MEQMQAALPSGFALGHWTDVAARTGCSVILCPPGTTGGCDIRGNSPGSRELALLGSERTLQEVHALLLTGGSAFGLAAADGVMKFLEEHNIGYQTPWARVPIVPAAVVYDLNVGSASVRPTAADGYRACANAVAVAVGGRIGAGTGATVGKWRGLDMSMPGGVGVAAATEGDLQLTAVAVVNAVGDVYDSGGKILAGARTTEGKWAADEPGPRAYDLPLASRIANTTLAAIITNARLSKVDANRVSQRGHDGMARSIIPVHTSFDGDIVFALAGGRVEAPFEVVAELGAAIVADAIRNAVRAAP